MAFSVIIARGSDWETSYDVWTKYGSVPLEEGDGIFVGNYTISPSQTGITQPVNYSAGYGFLVVPIIRRQGGPASGYQA